MNKKRLARNAARILALILAAHLAATAYQHHMSILDTAVIAIVTLSAFSTSLTTLVDRHAPSESTPTTPPSA